MVNIEKPGQQYSRYPGPDRASAGLAAPVTRDPINVVKDASRYI